MAAMIERGHIHRPAADILGRLASVLGISLDWLVLGKGPEPVADQVKTAIERASTPSGAAA